MPFSGVRRPTRAIRDEAEQRVVARFEAKVDEVALAARDDRGVEALCSWIGGSPFSVLMNCFTSSIVLPA